MLIVVLLGWFIFKLMNHIDRLQEQQISADRRRRQRILDELSKHEHDSDA
jgi:hypothetical protein